MLGAHVFIDGKDTECMISDRGMVWNKRLHRFMTLENTRSKHKRVKLSGERRMVHRIVAQYFVPNPDPEHKTYVNHIDGNPENNHYMNLEWVTAKENTQHAIRTGLWNPHHGHQQKGSKNGTSTHTEEQAHAVCKLLEEGHGLTETARILGVEYEFVRSMKRGWWQHVSCHYNIPPSKKYNYNMPRKYFQKNSNEEVIDQPPSID